jgi:hypothetical protein
MLGTNSGNTASRGCLPGSSMSALSCQQQGGEHPAESFLQLGFTTATLGQRKGHALRQYQNGCRNDQAVAGLNKNALLSCFALTIADAVLWRV